MYKVAKNVLHWSGFSGLYEKIHLFCFALFKDLIIHKHLNVSVMFSFVFNSIKPIKTITNVCLCKKFEIA